MRGQPTPENYAGRPSCLRCFRPHTLCLCNYAEPVQLPIDVLVLQHPNERGKYYGTLKLLQALAVNVRVLRGVIFDRNELIDAIGDRSPYILFPGACAQPMSSVSTPQRSVLVIIDGTWSEAGKIYRRNEYLAHLPSVKLEHAVSNYRIRKQPKRGCLSTIEAAVLAIEALPNLGPQATQACETLKSAFNVMVEQQLLFWPERPNFTFQ
jgi:DTW domain-containing protein YfiP